MAVEWRDRKPPRKKHSIRGVPTPWTLPIEWVADLCLRKKSPRSGMLELTLNDKRPEDFADFFAIEVKSRPLIRALQSRFGDPNAPDSSVAESGESEETTVDDE